MQLRQEDFPKGEYDKLAEFVSDTSDGSDIEETLSKKPEAAQLYESKLPQIPEVHKYNPGIVVLVKIPKKRVEKVKKILTDKIQKVLNDEKFGLKNTSFELELPLAEQETEKQMGTGKEQISLANMNQCMALRLALLKFSEQADIRTILDILSKLDIDHKYKPWACRFDDVPNIIHGEKQMIPPPPTCHSRVPLRDWLVERIDQEQFGYRCGNKGEVVWFDAISKRTEVVNPGDNEVQFDHEGVKHVLFSPNEQFLITCNDSKMSAQSINPPVIVWNCSTGRKLASLDLPPKSLDFSKNTDSSAWPLFSFSPDSSYIAARSKVGLTIYETATMTPMEESNSVSGTKLPWLSYPISQFQWSPTDNYMSFWMDEMGDTPGRLLIIDIDKKTEVASKNVFSVINVSMHWSDCGQYLALNTVIARRLHKKNKKEVTQIEVFRVKEKAVPVDIVDLEGLTIKSLHWEKGHEASRFATLTIEETTNSRKINFFEVPSRNSKQDTKMVQTLPVNPKINYFSWSPAGQYFVAASKGDGEHILFGVLNDQNKVDIITIEEHIDLTDILWDPSGRFVTTGSSAGFHIYSFLGRLLYRLDNTECRQFLWRPRPPPMISKDKLNEVNKKLKEYSKQFDAQDEAKRQARLTALKEEGQEKMAYLEAHWKKADEYLRNHVKYNVWSLIIVYDSCFMWQQMYNAWEKRWDALNTRLDWKEEIIATEKVINVQREQYRKTD